MSSEGDMSGAAVHETLQKSLRQCAVLPSKKLPIVSIGLGGARFGIGI